MNSDVVIIGAGISGLCCARQLEALGLTCLVLESNQFIGGRVRTDKVDGFLLDHGFQVLLTAYPEARRILDYNTLQLKNFTPGALIRSSNNFYSLYDPFRNPSKLLQTLFSPIGSFRDKVKIAQLKHKVQRGNYERLFKHSKLSTIEALQQIGFSDKIIKEFFIRKPYLLQCFYY